jgi:hypothetical protein
MLYMSYVISGFRRDLGDICAILGYYLAYGSSYLPTFRESLLVLEMGLIACHETLVMNYHQTLRNIPEDL